jgi:hypothetical protein
MHISSSPLHIGFASSAATPPPIIANAPLMASWDSTGSFWLPEAPSKTFWGTISFKAGLGISVVIEGNIVDDMSPGYAFDIPTVFARLHNGALLSAFDCVCAIESFYSGEQTFRTEIRSKFSISGGHWSKPEECVLASLQIGLSHLNDWFENPYRVNPVNSEFEEFSVTFEPDRLFASFNFNDIDVSLDTFCARSIPIWVRADGENWNYSYNLVVTPQSPQDLTWMLTLASSIRNFFSFLIGSGVYTIDLVGQQPSSGVAGNAVRIHRVVTVPRAMRVEGRYFSTTHKKFREIIPAVMDSWFKQERRFSLVFETYRELLCTDGASRATFLLRTTQTLEHLYGILWPSEAKYTSKATYRRFVGWIRDAFPTDLPHVDSEEMKKLAETKELLLSRIGGLNDISLRSKLERLFGEVPDALLLPIFENPRELTGFLSPFLARLEATRHFLTHFSEKQKEIAFDDQEIERAMLICWAVLTYWISFSIGFDSEASAHITLQAREAMFLVHSGVEL